MSIVHLDGGKAYEFIEETKLRPGGLVIDGGCSDWAYARAMINRRQKVIGFDPHISNSRPPRGMIFHNCAIATRALLGGKDQGHLSLVMAPGPHDRYVAEAVPHNKRARECGTKSIRAIAFEHIIETMLEGQKLSVLKLDCEGMEYHILPLIGRPIATQIYIEFHNFAFHNADKPEQTPKEYYAELCERLSPWYADATPEREYGCAEDEQAWCSHRLFVEK